MYRNVIATTAILIGCAGCSIPRSGGLPISDHVAIEIPAAVDLQRLESNADTKEEIYQIIHYYHNIQGDPDEVSHANTRTASLYLLLGAEYSGSRSEQKGWYREAADSAERALMQDKSFNTARIAGKTVPEAAEHIEEESFEALFLWATAVFYHFRDVASVPERILFSGRLKQAAQAIQLIIQKDPLWDGGSLQFSLGIYYLSVPEAIGGDREKASKLMEEAVRISSKRILTRWGRAKYLAVSMGDKELFLEDLNWVIQQDLSTMEGPVVWNRYFQKDARRLLIDVDDLF